MVKKKKMVIGNWKMNVAIVPDAKKLVQAVKRRTAKVKRTEIVFCPPAIYFHALAPLMKGKYTLGAQNVSSDDMGAHTGEISAQQLKQFGVSYVIVGHSERRKTGETDDIVSKKVGKVLLSGLLPVVCIGEWKRDDEGSHFEFVKNQLKASLSSVSKGTIGDVIIAYEPVWAIGAKSALDSRSIHEMSLYIRKCLREIFASYGDLVPIIYGGSANAENAKDIVENGNVSGLLPGRDSLDAHNFSEIVKAVDSVK